MERSSGSFLRTLRLPFEPDPEKITADCNNGVLTVHVPKEAQQQRSRRIEVRRGAGGQGTPRTIQSRSGAANNDEDRGVHRQAASQGATTQAGGADDSNQAQ